MAKEKERKFAQNLYVEQGKSAKEISDIIGVTEQTLSKWVNAYGWKEQRNAKLSSPTIRIDNIKSIINELSEKRLQLTKEIKVAEDGCDIDKASDLRKQVAHVDDSVSKWNKTLETIQSESRVSLGVYLTVMEMIFDSLKNFDEKLHFSTLDFQEKHLNEVSMKFN